MGKKDKNKKKGRGVEKTAMKTDKKFATKQKKLLAKIGEADIEEVVAQLEKEELRLKTSTVTVCPPPSPRSNFTICAHPEKDEIILHGGEFFNGQKIVVYNDLFFYNVSKNEWKLVKSPAGPAARSGHQMVSIAADGGQLWLFGGEHASPSQVQYYHFKDLWTFQLSTREWKKVDAPNGPSPRSGHRMVALKKKLVLFGGFHDNNQSYRYFNDVHIFSLEIYQWLKIDVSGAIVPLPRSGCCMAPTSDGKVLIWGGYSKVPLKKDADKGTTHSDMFVLTPDKSEPDTKFKWASVKAGGLKPNPRSGVAFATSANGKTYCFGGVADIDEDEENLEGQFSNDLYMLDLANNKWNLIEILKKSKGKNKNTEKNLQSQDNMEVEYVHGDFTLTVAGGSAEANSKKSSSSVGQFRPNPRMNAGLTILKGMLYVYGGLHEEGSMQVTLSDFYSIDLHKLDEWKVIISSVSNEHEWLNSDSDGSDTSLGDDDSDSDDSDSSSEMDTG